MADSSLKDRLRDHSEAFDSLLSLIPAKLYYGEDTSDQWQRKKQTKEQARAAKRSKLDPDSALNRNAKEVLDERVRNKRKAQELEPSEDGSAEDDDDAQELELRGISKEAPGEGLKKRKVVDDDTTETAKVAQPTANDEAKTGKLSAHQERKSAKKQKKAEKNAEKKKTKTKALDKGETVEEDGSAKRQEDDPTTPDDVRQSKEVVDEGETKPHKDMRPIDVSGLTEEDANHTSSSQASSPSSPTFDTAVPDEPSAEPESTTTSIASENTPADKSRKIKVPSDTTELRARLAAKIAALRAARKADGPDGKPIRTREELIESRRKKLAERKAHKKELRQKAKEAEDKKREEALASARNSPMLSFGSPEHDLNFSFGRVAFADGTQMSHDLTYTKDKSGKKKGPVDPKGALAKLEAQKKRLAELDDAKRKEVLEKETWLAARRRAEGEKVHNDESLLKKAVKRKDKAKKKSEKEWTERVQGVQKAQKQRQQKREENIRKRKETKQAGKGGKKKGGGKSTAKKSRPGFEGSGFGRRK
ncbi:hypothetical protein KVR01_012326 [Diaporthe batatas]|uniref:ribosome biosynthesis protein RRP14 n=1 Tax=Diaporthe batatas TaxID=748121 RepID=UPI001D04ED4A|nr:ribosome biosynthesis protein RRP14 [Diaporthe batatas]KAG8157664.1 hypothetical protein KVR01_012326 [Diaporthe batatas]